VAIQELPFLVAKFLRGLSWTLKTISMTIYHMPAARWFMKA